MKPLARFVTRPTNSKEGSKCDLVLGVCFGDQEILKPNTTYEIKDVLGALTIIEVGESCVQDYGPTNSPWALEFQLLMERMNKFFILTKKECRAIIKGANE